RAQLGELAVGRRLLCAQRLELLVLRGLLRAECVELAILRALLRAQLLELLVGVALLQAELRELLVVAGGRRRRPGRSSGRVLGRAQLLVELGHARAVRVALF